MDRPHHPARDNSLYVKTAPVDVAPGERGRPKNTWRRTVEKEREELGWRSGRKGQVVASDRRKLRSLLDGLMRPLGHEEDK
jgi:hypothetical protein